MNIDKNLPVMVTGATGYVAGWLVKRLLEAGLTVHAPVRNPDDAGKLKYLDEIAANTPGQIRYFKADLLKAGSYDAAMAGCQVVFHTASPLRLDVKDAQKELIEPAQLGTRNVLETVNRTPSVTRVVLTSSCAAISGDNADLDRTPDRMFTEAIWNTSSSLRYQPYSYSKTLAEREAWMLVAAQQRWDLVTINPSVVIGPGINPDSTSESFNLIRQLGDGTMKAGVANLGIGAVDVRDVADAHVRAAFTPEASGRYIVSGHNTNLPDMAATLLDRYGKDYPIPRRTLPKWLVWLAGPIASKFLTRKMVSLNVDRPWIGDNRRSRDELGIRYRPLAESMNEFFQQLVDSGRLAK
ncbi:diaminohydroxyphosphoribosylaminopyrimidine deaminase [Burkholderia lata]|uniref:NAD-dependent epimerase/dehydratase family protein n=1 Tax=Burkholderia lata (strain ATCC 17760 / DSM 23089 / LMG 22485 / NCIMB 9086 / R18194 / 383) TaxID=482957 RepID=UPI001454794A|nr:NAD-dependent epimerase/dehydratase family protein [Burkholderia lata]VWD59515.1 diaminohydroxyphosphoribosylaminopyrimidine deaminase [Burkholderia lata]